MELRRLYLEYLSPVTRYYKSIQLLYRMGIRPKPNSLFYAKVLDDESHLLGRFKR